MSKQSFVKNQLEKEVKQKLTKPLFRLLCAWKAYVVRDLNLLQAASVVGISTKQFLELGQGLNCFNDNVPIILQNQANTQESTLLTLINNRQLDLLVKLLDKPILLTKNCDISLRDDLNLLEALDLVKVNKYHIFRIYIISLSKLNSK